MIADMDSRLPLSTLLSQALVAFTIELDNEFERLMPHRTTKTVPTGGLPKAPWLVSMVMWSRFLRFIRRDGISVRELRELAQVSPKELGMWLRRMAHWWGYVTVESAGAGGRAKRPHSEIVVRPTSAGQKAREIWRALFPVIEARWRDRFGDADVGRLRQALGAIVEQIDADLPDYLPILKYGLFTKDADYRKRSGEAASVVSQLTLPALLSKVLLAFAIAFEDESKVSLAICANVLRVAGDGAARIRDLPRLAGVSKEAVAMAVGFLEKRGYASVELESPGARIKVLTLNSKGRHAKDVYQNLVWDIEERWGGRFGKEAVASLRDALEQVVGKPTTTGSPLFAGLEPYPDGWRASLPRPLGLPHYPMVLHRGGWPDGS